VRTWASLEIEETAPLAPENLSRGILPTDISPWLARALTSLFLAMIFAVSLVQVAVELGQRQDVQALEVFRRLPTQDNLHGYEKELDRQSVVKQRVQPWLQEALSRYLRYGNSNVIVGNEGWLFYRPGVDFLAGPGLLDQTRLRLREKELAEAGEKNPCPDPRPAIRAFHDDCRRAGVHLVVVPIPDKAMLQPAELTRRLTFVEPVPVSANTDYPRLLEELRAAGLDIFDPAPVRLAPGEPARFLRQDTHWTPQWMECVAHDLAEHLKARVPFPPETGRTFVTQETEIHRVGDLVDMLNLPAGQSLFPPQTVTIRRVLEPSGGAAWQPRTEAGVLLLGDSFSNIYCTTDLGWGEAAGFPAQLARFLCRDVDVIAHNGSGATLTRRELARRPASLAGKRVVVWEFAVRDLALASWDVVPRPAGPPNQPPGADLAAPLIVEGTVTETSHVPRPFSGPYKDCVTYVKLHVDRLVAGTYADGQLIAVFWGMKDNVLQPAAHYALGKRLHLKVVPLTQVPVSWRNVQRADDLEDCDHQPYFVLEEHGL
jgi:hypothetical protein